MGVNMKRILSCFIIGLLLLFSSISESSQVTLVWNPSSSNPDGYKVFEKLAGGNYNYSTPVYSGDASTTQVLITNLQVGQTYNFVARAVIGTDESLNSNEVIYLATEDTLNKVIQIQFSATTFNKREAVEYYGTTDKLLQCSWPVVALAEGYEVVLHNIEKNSDSAAGKTTSTSITFKLPKTGHYVVKARACRKNYTECTDWSSSDNPDEAVVTGLPKGWIVFGTIANPGPPVLD
jgi:hypothetical protein